MRTAPFFLSRICFQNATARTRRCANTSSRRSRRPTLLQPTIIYTSNHLLVVNKPAGWHSIPLDDHRESPKCLLSWLKRQSLGGGSAHQFLLPLHRLDQPCTGLLLFGKTTKAASRITNMWKKHQVLKEYTCLLLSDNHLSALKRSSRRLGKDWYEIKGCMKRSRKQGSIRMIKSSSSSLLEEEIGMRECSAKWKVTGSIGNNPLIIVQTNDGARHMIRSLLASVGNAPICGDLRYGASFPLPDQSVALHASKVLLPESLVLPLAQKEFVAPIPALWKTWFGSQSNHD